MSLKRLRVSKDEVQIAIQIKDAARRELARRELARRKLAHFIRYMFPTDAEGNSLYIMGWVHELICRKLEQFLEDVKNKKSPRLAISMPPRHGKSAIVSNYFPAWVFGHQRDFTIIGATYSSGLAAIVNKSIQSIMENELYPNIFPDTKIVQWGKGIRNSGMFQIADSYGYFRAAGVQAAITGMGAHILNIDDPVRDRAEANSKTYRDKTWDWYASTALTRLAPGGGVLLTMTRWHEDDLEGRLLAKAADDGEKWDIINFPAIALQDEEYRKEGEALHPERFSVEQLLTIKKTIGPYEWSALYEQNPSSAEGAIFKNDWVKFYREEDLPKILDTIVISWDMTFKDADDSDFVVGQVWGKFQSNFYLLEQVRGRWSFTQSCNKVVELAQKYDYHTILIEEKANGAAIIDNLKNHVHSIVPVNPETSKVARAFAVTGMWEAGNIYLPLQDFSNPLSWVYNFISEVTSFPTGAHDDQVDAMTQALRFMQQHDVSIWERIL